MFSWFTGGAEEKPVKKDPFDYFKPRFETMRSELTRVTKQPPKEDVTVEMAFMEVKTAIALDNDLVAAALEGRCTVEQIEAAFHIDKGVLTSEMMAELKPVFYTAGVIFSGDDAKLANLDQ